MRKYNAVFAGLFLAGLLSPLTSQAQWATSDIRALASSPQWLTTKVYIEGATHVDVKDKYPGVVGISMWYS
ncbi:hypothetical protein [Pseudomonas gessardii]|uniref:hypothetical protein n=1 Tax=Pseudomonas gessardii TaxID=78544 RepID=UPI0039AFD5A4